MNKKNNNNNNNNDDDDDDDDDNNNIKVKILRWFSFLSQNLNLVLVFLLVSITSSFL